MRTQSRACGAGTLSVPTAPPPTLGDEIADGTSSPSDGLVLAWGWNAHGQLGLGDDNVRPDPRPLRSLLASGVRICFLSAGSSHSVAVDDRGGAYSFGGNSHGQLGVGDCGDRLVPCRLDTDGQRVVDVACGARHTVLCTARGRVFGCGDHAQGQLGLGPLSDDPSAVSLDLVESLNVRPRTLASMSGVRCSALSAGFAHTLFLTRPGQVLACGAGESGQLGTGSAEERVTSPAVVGGLASVACCAVAAGNYHSCALARDGGGVYTWGEGRYGRLGHGTAASELLPRLVHGLLATKVDVLTCGGACTACIDDGGGLWTWGSASWGQCGHGTQVIDELEPRYVQALAAYPLRSVGCAEDHMVGVSRGGQVRSLGH